MFRYRNYPVVQYTSPTCAGTGCFSERRSIKDGVSSPAVATRAYRSSPLDGVVRCRESSGRVFTPDSAPQIDMTAYRGDGVAVSSHLGSRAIPDFSTIQRKRKKTAKKVDIGVIGALAFQWRLIYLVDGDCVSDVTSQPTQTNHFAAELSDVCRRRGLLGKSWPVCSNEIGDKVSDRLQGRCGLHCLAAHLVESLG